LNKKFLIEAADRIIDKIIGSGKKIEIWKK
jgi:hypothetical protein